MIQIFMSDSGDYKIPISLTANTKLEGTYIDAKTASAVTNVKVDKTLNVSATAKSVANAKSIKSPTNTNILSVEKKTITSNDIKNYFNSNDYFVTGTTSSKYESLFKSFIDLPIVSPVTETFGVNSLLPQKNQDNSVVIDKKILLNGTDIFGMILRNDNIKEYVLYIDTEYPIKYVDFPDGTTIFKYKAAPDYEVMDGKILYYNGLVTEPKILSEVFIDRGVNNVFEPVKRLKNVDNLKELIKVGLGYYKVNSTGFNFKNAK